MKWSREKVTEMVKSLESTSQKESNKSSSPCTVEDPRGIPQLKKSRKKENVA